MKPKTGGKAGVSRIEGRIISGEYDNEMNVFTIQKLKQFFVESVLQPHQLHQLSTYLKNQQNFHSLNGTSVYFHVAFIFIYRKFKLNLYSTSSYGK